MWVGWMELTENSNFLLVSGLFFVTLIKIAMTYLIMKIKILGLLGI